MSTRFQIPSFQILGLPAPEIQEARERIMSAFMASGFDFPKKKVIVNLAPSALPKSGTGHDLAIAITVLQEVLDLPWPEQLLAWGELGLTGKIKPCHYLGTIIELLLAETNTITLVLCTEDAVQFYTYLAWRIENHLPIPKNFKLIKIDHLNEIPEQLQTPIAFDFEKLKLNSTSSQALNRDYRLLLPLQPRVKHLLQIAMTGRHHTLLLGPKGVGKSQALEWFKALTPQSQPMQTWTRLLHSQNQLKPFSFETPIRRVHSQVKPAHLLGNLSPKGFRSGELALAHGGLFIADEFLEWHRDAKECLREPLENKKVHLTKIKGTIEFECDVQFVGTGNLCRCGGMPLVFHDQVPREQYQKIKNELPHCRCRQSEVLDYFSKISGPIADRIDLMSVISPSHPFTADNISGETQFYSLQKTIQEARDFSHQHFGTLSSEIPVQWLEKNIPKTPSIEKLLLPISSLRSRHKILRIAHTLQAVSLSEKLKEEHVFEAIHLRWKEVNH